jgi:hypothetical protein
MAEWSDFRGASIFVDAGVAQYVVSIAKWEIFSQAIPSRRPPTRVSVAAMNTIPVTPQIREIDYLKTWALFTVCAMVGGGVAGAVFGGVLGGFLGVAKVPIETIKTVAGIAGFIISLPISYLFFRLFVSRFIVQKLALRNVSEGVPPIPLT